jgi:hypothetical protein
VNNNNTVIYNGGPNYNALRRQASIRRANIDRVSAVQPGKRPRNTLRGNQLRVVAPHVQRRPGAKPRHVAAHVPKGRTDRGWSAIKDRRQAQAVRQRMRNEARQATGKSANTTAARHRQAQAAARTAPGQTRNPHAAVNPRHAATHQKRREVATTPTQQRRANAAKAEANRPRPSHAQAGSQRVPQQRPPARVQSRVHAQPKAQAHPSRQRPQPRHEAARNNRPPTAQQHHRQQQVRQPSRPPQAQHQRQRPPAHRPQPQAQRARQNQAHAATQHPQGDGKKKKKNQ